MNLVGHNKTMKILHVKLSPYFNVDTIAMPTEHIDSMANCLLSYYYVIQVYRVQPYIYSIFIHKVLETWICMVASYTMDVGRV